MMNERGIRLAHTTILRWVQHYTPEFEKRWKRYARPVGGSWRMDETYVKVRGEWVYLYRAVDKAESPTGYQRGQSILRIPAKVSADSEGKAERHSGPKANDPTAYVSRGASL